MPTLTEILAAKRRTTDSVDIILDPPLADAFHEAKAARDEARKALAAMATDETLRLALEDAQEALDAAEEALGPVVATFTFEALGGHEYEALKNANAPTKEQRRERGALLYNPETFQPALVAACAIDPVITMDEAEAMWKSPDWNAGELSALFFCALNVQSSRRTDDLPKGSGPTQS